MVMMLIVAVSMVYYRMNTHVLIYLHVLNYSCTYTLQYCFIHLTKNSFFLNTRKSGL